MPCSPRGNADRLDCPADFGVAQDIVGACGLLNPQRIEFGKLLYPVNCLGHIPHLVRIDHEIALGADHFAGDPEAADVILQ
jgi:hypothetical protein